MPLLVKQVAQDAARGPGLALQAMPYSRKGSNIYVAKRCSTVGPCRQSWFAMQGM